MISEDVKLDKWFAHEALDRVYLILDMFEEYVGRHPVISQTPHLIEKALEISDSMGKFYQLVSNETAKYYEDTSSE